MKRRKNPQVQCVSVLYIFFAVYGITMTIYIVLLTHQPAAVAPKATSHFGENHEIHPPARVPVGRLGEQPKPSSTNPPPERKLPNLGNWHVSPEVIYVCFCFLNFQLFSF